jgi:hypothetical protein
VSPAGSHVGAAHFPCAQALEQQSLGPLHVSPSVPHAPEPVDGEPGPLPGPLVVVGAEPESTPDPDAGGVYPQSGVESSGVAAHATISDAANVTAAMPAAIRAIAAAPRKRCAAMCAHWGLCVSR